jgi:hypothetical protein
MVFSSSVQKTMKSDTSEEEEENLLHFIGYFS